LFQRSIVDDSDIDGQPVRKRKTPSPVVSPSHAAVGRSSPPIRPVKKTARPVKKKIVVSSITDDVDNNEQQPVPTSPPKPVIKKTSKPAKKEAAASTASQLPRRSPRQQKPSSREVLAAKMKIGASIIPGAVTVVPVS